MTATATMHKFDSTEEREAFIDEQFRDRKATEVPGYFELPDGRGVGVFCLTVTVYTPERA